MKKGHYSLSCAAKLSAPSVLIKKLLFRQKILWGNYLQIFSVRQRNVTNPRLIDSNRNVINTCQILEIFILQLFICESNYCQKGKTVKEYNFPSMRLMPW